MNIASILFCGLSGCSLFDMTPVKTPIDPQKESPCTSSFGNPAVDTVITIGAGAATVVAALNAQNAAVTSSGNTLIDNRNLAQTNAKNDALIIGSGVLAALYGTSAVYGYHTASQCEEAKIKWENAQRVARLQEDQRRVSDWEIHTKKEEQALIQANLEIEERKKANEIAKQKLWCEVSYSRRMDSGKKLLLHSSTKTWVDENKMQAPIYKNTLDVDTRTGSVVGRKDIVGTRTYWPSTGRPSKLDGKPLLDQDIMSGNYATDDDSVEEWSKDSEYTDSCNKLGSL